MSFSIASSGSSGNPSLAWVMGNRGKGRMLIKFPLPLDKGWYHEQPCTTFHTLEHRKERSGFQHEFIVLKLLDGSVCRVERMGDPNARFEALSTQGTVAHDIAQCFRPDELDQACLDTSDTIAEIRLPCDFDLMDVLKVCRAIQEGEKTCNYTLQVFNCFFFSLAIQACLVRLVAHWENQELLRAWLLRVQRGVRALKRGFKSNISDAPHALNRIYSALTLGHKHLPPSFEQEVVCRLQKRWICPTSTEQRKRMACYLNQVLWHSAIRLGLEQFVEDEVRGTMADVLKEISTRTRSTRADLLLILAQLVTPNRVPPNAARFSINQKGLNRHESRSKIAVAELTFKKTQASCAAGIATDRSQLISGGVAYIWYLVLWALSAVLCPLFKVGSLLKVSPAQGSILDYKLGSIAVELEGLGNIHRSKLKETYLEMKALVQSGLGATWDQNPWASLCRLVTHHLSDNMLEAVDSNQSALILCVEPQSIPSSISVPDFQDHILARIKIHAELVQSVWLGSSGNIETELKCTLSQVWGLIREDDALVKKVPLANSVWSKGLTQKSNVSPGVTSVTTTSIKVNATEAASRATSPAPTATATTSPKPVQSPTDGIALDTITPTQPADAAASTSSVTTVPPTTPAASTAPAAVSTPSELDKGNVHLHSLGLAPPPILVNLPHRPSSPSEPASPDYGEITSSPPHVAATLAPASANTNNSTPASTTIASATSPADGSHPEVPKVTTNGTDSAKPGERRLSEAFREFVINEKQRLAQKRLDIANSEKEKRMAELVAFSFKLNKPTHEELVSILTKDSEKAKSTVDSRVGTSKNAMSQEGSGFLEPTSSTIRA